MGLTDTAAWRNFNLSKVSRENNSGVISDSRMTPLPVVKHLDVFAYCVFRLCSCREVPVVNQLCLQTPQKLSIGPLSKQFPFRDIDTRKPN
jgi:hypothetical protein